MFLKWYKYNFQGRTLFLRLFTSQLQKKCIQKFSYNWKKVGCSLKSGNMWPILSFSGERSYSIIWLCLFVLNILLFFLNPTSGYGWQQRRARPPKGSRTQQLQTTYPLILRTLSGSPNCALWYVVPVLVKAFPLLIQSMLLICRYNFQLLCATLHLSNDALRVTLQ